MTQEQRLQLILRGGNTLNRKGWMGKDEEASYPALFPAIRPRGSICRSQVLRMKRGGVEFADEVVQRYES